MGKMNDNFTECGMQSITYVLDNKASQHLKDVIAKKAITFQIIPPYMHRENLSRKDNPAF